MIRIEVAELDGLVDTLERLLDAYAAGLQDTLDRDRARALELAARSAPHVTGRLS